MIDKDTLLVDLNRLRDFKGFCDQTYAKKGEDVSPSASYPVYVADDTLSEDDVLAVINAKQ